MKIKNDCTEFTDMVFRRSPGIDNIISADKVKENGIDDIFRRLHHYIQERPICYSVIRSVIIELLYHLNKLVVKSNRFHYKHENIKNILAYIHDHLTEDLSLDGIAENFFFSKQHLCKIFKENTGFTIHKYISYKRIVLVRELHSKGLSLTEACRCAGFHEYSSFYRTYIGITGKPPQKSMSDR
ncbi:MAG: helix-turn-helix transcriptional regulator [Lachnospiraceae bacterium]|nr:helix-turn-helix transcriptional regulator [Lachnospiraceae bacterium]